MAAANLIKVHTKGLNTLTVLALLLGLLLWQSVAPQFSSAAGQGPSDNFDDNTTDLSLWTPYVTGSGPTVAETNQRLEIALPDNSVETGQGTFNGVYLSVCQLRGDFDIQVDYHLPVWPARNGVRLALGTDLGATTRASKGTSSDPIPSNESYFNNFGDGIFNFISTSDLSGKLRQVRSGSTRTGYYFSSGDWVAIHSSTGTTADVHFWLAAWSHDFTFTDQEVQVAFDNFVVNVGQLICPDATPPEITPTVVGTLGDNGWYISDVSVSWSVSDPESAVTSTTGCDPAVVDADTAGTTFTCEATSDGGASSQTVIVKRDATPPAVSVTGVSDGGVYTLGAVPAAACDTADSLSGVETPAAVTVTGGNANGVGTFTATCSGAQDQAGNAGNVATAAYKVVYVFAGFSDPVKNDGVLNVAKAGQTVPLKWRITDALGNPVTNLSTATVTVVNYDCSLPETENQVQEYAAGNSGLQNLGDGYYQFNWKTPKTYAGSCKEMRLDLEEGIFHTALFEFT